MNKRFRAIAIIALSLAAIPALAQSPPKPWMYCSFAGQNSSLVATPVFRTPLDPGWRKEFEQVHFDLRTSVVSCGSYATAEEAAAGRQQYIDFYNSNGWLGPRSVFAVAPPAQSPSGDAPATAGPVGAPVVAVDDLSKLKEQGRLTVVKIAQSPPMLARNEALEKKRRDERMARSDGKPAASEEKTCPLVPRRVTPISGIRESQAEADTESRDKATRACGPQGTASITQSCTTHMKEIVTMLGSKTSVARSPRWVCSPKAICVATEPKCAPSTAPKGSSKQ